VWAYGPTYTEGHRQEDQDLRLVLGKKFENWTEKYLKQKKGSNDLPSKSKFLNSDISMAPKKKKQKNQLGLCQGVWDRKYLHAIAELTWHIKTEELMLFKHIIVRISKQHFKNLYLKLNLS
jgi:hypothetical protein